MSGIDISRGEDVERTEFAFHTACLLAGSGDRDIRFLRNCSYNHSGTVGGVEYDVVKTFIGIPYLSVLLAPAVKAHVRNHGSSLGCETSDSRIMLIGRDRTEYIFS